MIKRTADVTNAHGPLEQSMNGAITPTVQGTPARRRCAGGGRAQDHRQREHAEREGVLSFWRKGDRQPRIAEVQAADFELSKIVLPNSISGLCVPESSNGQGGHPVKTGVRSGVPARGGLGAAGEESTGEPERLCPQARVPALSDACSGGTAVNARLQQGRTETDGESGKGERPERA